MRDQLILLPGWGLGVSPLEPLAAALHGLNEHLQVQIEPLPALQASELGEWLDELDATLPDNAWLGGWSLGGMLASELAARRGERCCGLLTLASNPCFVAHDGWPHGMPTETFDAFLAGCHADSQVTLKRFGLFSRLGEQRFFSTLGEAVKRYLVVESVAWVDWEDRAGEAAPGMPEEASTGPLSDPSAAAR